jgi:single-strand DNA-binding protein
MKVITIIGRLTKECEVRKNDRGEFATFSVAVDDGYGDRKGTIYFGVNFWRTQLAQYLSKGTQVGVTGEFKTREYEGKTYMSINASEVKLLGKKPENNRYVEGDKIENTQTANDQRKAVEVEEFDDEIPF